MWAKPAAPKNKRYAAQTASEIAERCVLMSTDPGDLVLDPACGGGTLPLAAEKWGRRWAAIDASPVAIGAARRALLTASHPRHQIEGGGIGPAAGSRCEAVPTVTASSLAYDRDAGQVLLADRPLPARPAPARPTGPFAVLRACPPTSRQHRDGSDRWPAAESPAIDRVAVALLAGPVRDPEGRPMFYSAEVGTAVPGMLEAEIRPAGREGPTRKALIAVACPQAEIGAEAVAAIAADALAAGAECAIAVATAFAPQPADAPSRVLCVAARADLHLAGVEPPDSPLTLLGRPDAHLICAGADATAVFSGYTVPNPFAEPVRYGPDRLAVCMAGPVASGGPLTPLGCAAGGASAAASRSAAAQAERDGALAVPIPGWEGGPLVAKIVAADGSEMAAALNLPP